MKTEAMNEENISLILRADASCKVSLWSDYKDGQEIAPVCIREEDGQKCYYYAQLQGRCRYILEQDGCYTIRKNLYIHENAPATVLDIATEKMVGTGFEPVRVDLYSDGILKNAVPSGRELWPDYQDVYGAPYFQNKKVGHQVTTQQEMEDYIAAVEEMSANMYAYTLGVSPQYGYRLPIVVFTKTDLSGAKTLEEAAALVSANGKLTVHYQAYVHGSEPAGGEAALAMIGILAGSYGDELLEHMNIYVIPRMNPDGAHNFKRTNAAGADMNRDLLMADAVEIRAQHKALKLFDPEVCIDSHEYTTNADRILDSFRDMMIASGWEPGSDEAFVELNEAVARAPFAPLFANGMQPCYYVHETNSGSPVFGTRYMSLRGAVSILLESRGINSGVMVYERRVSAHVISVKAILNYVRENLDKVRQVIGEVRQKTVTSGCTYDPENVLVMESELVEQEHLAHPLTRYDTGTGQVISTDTRIPKSIAKILRTRPMPTAYVIPAGESWADFVLEIMDRNGIVYRKLEAGTALWLQQYTGTIKEAQLGQETKVTFPNGAYVFQMNQRCGKLLPNLMEPDLNVAYASSVSMKVGTLAQIDVIPAEGDAFPIYRSIRDLNADGEIVVE